MSGLEKNKFMLLAVLGGALSVALLASCGGSKAETKKKGDAAAAATPAVIDVATASAVMRELPRFFEATGSLAADEQTDVAPAVSGKVVAVGVDLGSFVQRGAVLARLDDSDARIRLEQAQAQVQQQQAGVRQAQARIGLRGNQSFDPARVAEVGSARVALELAEKQLRRFERLVATGDVSRSAYDQQKAQRDQLQQQVEVAVTAARQNYAAVQTAQATVTAAQTQIDQARKNIRDAVVTAPISGFVADRPADVGEYVTPASKIATIVRTNPLRVRIDVPEQAIGSAQAGQSVSVSVSAYPDRSFNGRVVRISPNVTAASRTLTVEAEVENSNNQLKPGQFATVRVWQTKSAPAVLVPQKSVRTENGSSRVFVINKSGRAEERLVQIGQQEGDLIEIKNGVAADELVATSNVDQLSDGVAVRQ
ncbi:MAG: efflux RND transporter periplasmic adaptor subunit [Pyrinomonadaceae bacterium]